ncbi:MAG: phosphotransferase enzyme family protein [Acetobacteraceae bacterium]
MLSEALQQIRVTRRSASLKSGESLQGSLRIAGPGFRTLSVTGPVAERSLSTIFYGEGGVYSRPVAIKICLDPGTRRPSGRAARSYFEALRRGSSVSRVYPDFACATAHDLIEDLGVVIMEWIKGPTLARHLLWSSAETAACRLAEAGIWLSRLHAVETLGQRPIDTALLLDQLRSIGDFPTQVAASPLLSRALDCLERTAEQVGRDDVPWARGHGDFKPRNLMISDGRLVGLDLGLLFNSPVLYDLAYFLNHLALLLATFRAIRPSIPMWRLTEAFLAGYRQNADATIHESQLAWVRLQHALRMLATLRTWSRPPKVWFSSWYVRRLISSLSASLHDRMSLHRVG